MHVTSNEIPGALGKNRQLKINGRINNKEKTVENIYSRISLCSAQSYRLGAIDLVGSFRKYEKSNVSQKCLVIL